MWYHFRFDSPGDKERERDALVDSGFSEEADGAGDEERPLLVTSGFSDWPNGGDEYDGSEESG